MGARARKRDGAGDPDLCRIQEAVRQLSADHLDYRIEAGPTTPLGPFEEEFNRMAERLGRRRDEVVRAVELYCLHRLAPCWCMTSRTWPPVCTSSRTT